MHRNIHCQVIMGPIIVPAPPLTCTSSALTSRETKMPSTMPSCCSEPSTPRCLVGDISVIYIGATTEATPAANPPNTRNATRISMFGANAQPIPHTRKQTAAIFIIGTRPTLSAMRPDSSALMHPVISAEPTARPSTASPV